MLISIILPLFNMENYIGECIRRLTKLNLSFLEIIIVNDGSTDSSGNIADSYAQQYDYIRVIHQSNQGVSAARNSALRKAQGRYLVFVDADDIIYDNFFKTILPFIKGQPDIIEINANSIDEKGVLLKESIFSFIGTQKKINNTKHAKLTFTQQAKYYLWSRIIRRDLIKDLKFDDRIGFCEDALYLTECYFRATKIITVDQCLYGYRHHATNITKNNASSNIDQLADLAEIIKHKIIASTDTNYKNYYLLLLINMIHLRKSMYAINKQHVACDEVSLNNIDSVKALTQGAYLIQMSDISWLRRFSILAPKTSNLLILTKVFLKKP